MLVKQLPISLYFLFGMFQESFGLYCLQCSGWYGWYSPGRESVSTCDNSNNACTSTNYCVRIVDPIFKYRHYKTFKADCYTSNTFASLTNTSTIVNGKCYNYTDGGSPPKTYLYCFCNDRDYCNGAISLKSMGAHFTFMLISISLFYNQVL